MTLLRYFVALLFGAMGSLSILRALEVLLFGGGEGRPGMQLALGGGFLLVALKALRSGRRRLRKRPAEAEIPPTARPL